MIDSEDLYKQEKIYTKSGKGRWKVLGYCSSPSVTMVDTKSGEQCNFGIHGMLNAEFEEISVEVIEDEKYKPVEGDIEAALRGLVQDVLHGTKSNCAIIADWDHTRGTDWITSTRKRDQVSKTTDKD